MSPPIQREISVEEKYGFIKRIGKGSYGEVWLVAPLATIAKGTRYVVKRLNLQFATDQALEVAEQEAKLLSTLKHPNIITYVESFRSWDYCLNIVMHYCEDGDLYKKIREKQSEGRMFEEAKVIEWCIQICMALQYIHERYIIHRDLKTQNIFLTKHGIIKVGDFGISRVLDNANGLAKTIIGTPYYMSPEMFSNIPYDQKSDIWSLGCCMYELVNLETAFQATDMNSLILKIIRGDIPKIQGNYSDELKGIIKAMLSKQSHHRPTAKEVLENKYIKQYIKQMLEDTKRRIQNRTSRKHSGKQNDLTLPSESELPSESVINNVTSTTMTDSYPGEARTRRRQRIASQQQSTFHTTVESTVAVTTNTNNLLSNTDELEIWEQFPIKTLTHYFEEHEREDEDNHHDIQNKNNLTNVLHSYPDTRNTHVKQEATTTVPYRPMAIVTVKVPGEDQNKINCRYFDIGTLPKQTLLPITGYNITPLTSLEDSIRPVEHLLDDINIKIIVAKQNAQQRHGILSVEESAAIQLYTMETLPSDHSLYYNLNKTLRSASRQELIPWFPYLKLLMTALWKLPSVQRTVWRGIKNVDLSNEYQEGQCYTWWNLSSCTESLTVIQTSQFLGTDGSQTLFCIECENGKQIKEHSYLGHENEILLPPATYFKVLGKANLTTDVHVIHVQQLSPPYQLISPPF